MKDNIRIAITGLGAITPLENGKGVGSLWDLLIQGKDGIKDVKSVKTDGLYCSVGGEVSIADSQEDPSVSRCTKLFDLAAVQALSDAQLTEGLPENTGVSFGTILAGMNKEEKYFNKIFSSNESDGEILSNYDPQATPAYISRKYRIKGPNIAVNSACSSSTDAIGVAINEIRLGRTKTMLAGGSDVMSEMMYRGFTAIGAMTRSGCVSPFDANRSGMAVSEGAGVIVLEEYDHALSRGAKIYAEVVGYGSALDGYNLVRPHKEGEGLANAIREALSEAGVNPDDVDMISAHGTGTVHNDLSETRAIKSAFGNYADSLKICAIKSMLGHTMGASAVLGSIAAILSIETGKIPPTINHSTKDEECDLNYLTDGSVDCNVKCAMSLSAGFGGQNSALVFSKRGGAK